MASLFEKIRFHFMEAMELKDSSEQERYIEKCCRDHPDIENRLQAMFHAHREHAAEESTGEFESPPLDASAFGDNFDIIKMLGEGGFGVVYLAEEHKPLRRLVALKVLKPGMDSQEVIERFRMEQGALAIMNHPSISKVLETGTTKDGRPFFVMEYVEGLPITEYCDENVLSITERLALFSNVCHAVAHAHQKGVIHRDLKPSNIMVAEFEDSHLPKVIDFGIAKAISPELLEDSFQTKNFHLIGSPLYMSPEQAGKKEFSIDTRTDVYSMGALLYQLIVGVPTYDPDRLAGEDLLSTLEIIKDETIPTVSQRFGKLDSEKQADCARKRCNTLTEHSKALNGEISWIIGKAIEKNPDDRYQSIMELDQDIHNYLNNRPLAARAPSRLYLTKKFILRNRLGVGVFAAVSVLLVSALIFSLWQLNRAFNAEILADLRLAAAKKAQEESSRNLKNLMAAEEAARNLVYAGDVGLAAEEEKNGDVSSAISLLNRQIPVKATDPDLRGIEWTFVKRLLNRDHQVIAQSNRYCFVRYLPNSNWLVAGDYNGNVTLFDAKTLRQVHAFSAHMGMVNFVDIDRDGKRLATIGDDGFVRIWVPSKPKPVNSFRVDESYAHRVYFLNETDRVITSGTEQEVEIWNWRSGQRESQVDNIDTEVRGNLVLSPDRSFVVTTPKYYWVRRYEFPGIERPKIKFDTKNEGGYCRCLAISRDGRMVAAGRQDYSVTVWDAKDGSILHHFNGHRDDVQSLSFHPDGKLLASSDRSGVIRFWNVARTTAEPNPSLEQWPVAIMAHSDRVWSIDFSQDGSKLVSASRDETVKIWSGRPRKKLDIAVKSDYCYLAWKSDHELYCSEMNRLYLWNTETGKRQLLETFPESEYISFVDIDKLKRRVAVATIDGNVNVYEVDGHKRILKFNAHGETSVKCVRFSNPAFNQLITTGGDYRAVCWDLNSGKPVNQLEFDRKFDDIELTKHDHQVLLCFENDVHLWDVSKVNQAVPHLLGHQNTAECLCLCDDRSTIVTGSDDRTIKVWDAESGEMRHSISGHDYKILSIASSPINSTVVAGDDGGFLSFSNVENGRFIMQYDLKRFWPHVNNRNATEVSDICFSPDHSKFAVAVNRRGILIFDCSLPKLGPSE